MKFFYSLLILSSVLSACQSTPPSKERSPTSLPKFECSLIDSDMATDDLRAIALLTPHFKKNIIVTTEGFTRTYYGTKIAEKLFQSTSIPIEAFIYQGKSAQQTFLATWLTEQREIHETMNRFLPMRIPASAPNTIEQSDFEKNIRDCKKVHVFLLGPYTSFAAYQPFIKRKTKEIFVYGKPIKNPKDSYFNCYYDKESCLEFSKSKIKPQFVQLPEVTKLEFQMKPDTINALDTRSLSGLIKSVHEADTTSWQTDKSLMWDDAVALYFLHPKKFKKENNVYVPNMKAAEFRELWLSSLQIN